MLEKFSVKSKLLYDSNRNHRKVENNQRKKSNNRSCVYAAFRSMAGHVTRAALKIVSHITGSS